MSSNSCVFWGSAVLKQLFVACYNVFYWHWLINCCFEMDGVRQKEMERERVVWERGVLSTQNSWFWRESEQLKPLLICINYLWLEHDEKILLNQHFSTYFFLIFTEKAFPHHHHRRTTIITFVFLLKLYIFSKTRFYCWNTQPFNMFSPDYEKRILKHCSPVARNLFNSFEAASTTSSLDRFIPCR